MLVWLVLISAGCGPSPEEIVEQHRGRAVERLELLAAVLEKAMASDLETAVIDERRPSEGTGSEDEIAAPLESAPESTSGPGDPSLPTLPEKLCFHGPGRNAALIHLEVLDVDPSTRPPLDLIIPSDWLTWIREALDDRAIPNAELLESSFQQLIDLKYLAVIRTKHYSEPVELYDEQFAPGWWEAELLLFQIDSGTEIAALPLEASNQHHVRVREDTVASGLRSDIWARARESVRIACDPFCAEGTRAIP
ncbi:MAG: hypothetical protein RL885_23050 [Planctomycetota bacterium]